MKEININHTRSKIPSLAIVVPCYNEKEAFPYCLEGLTTVLQNLLEKEKIARNSYILFVDDGSKDNTWEQIKSTSQEKSFVRGLKLSRNRGHQIALLAGLANADTDVTVSIDADLQDDIGCIEKMIDKYNEGFEIVYGVRDNRSSDSVFKRATANKFYSLMSGLGVNQVPNHADFRLLSRTALTALKDFKEQNLYLRGLIPLLGYKSSSVYYSRDKRVAGESKYPLKKMVALALEGITSLTITPLRMIAAAGVATCLLSSLAAIYAFIEKLLGNTVAGWTSVMIAIFFLGGVQMLSLGIIGEYVGKIYMESKNRPKYFIEEVAKHEMRGEQ
ncbi:glycosyltransferase family 2 protein [Klebsiella michiganensis]|uniref:glycosyltransferase family 2 protein n=1 Tax=Klebsiella michiganensis TaxID=1134687 RepID=UPI0006501ADD|nr:glycosyltransferase family 2 protein [Klebsiella michiganensis]KMK46018.1 glycosyltransferase [Klebsiella michiganensis]NNS00068.1 glycosyltransferase family 2 protein [Klebsiella michiganensis]